MIPPIRDYPALYRQFRWQVPAIYNIGVDVCDRWAAVDPRRLAILHVLADGTTQEITFGWLRETSNRLANVLRAHGVKRGDRVAILLPHDFFPQPGDRFWTPADWAWAGGLLDVLLPSLHHGVAVVARKLDKFDPEEAFALMAKTGVRNSFIPPTALRMLRTAPDPRGRHALNLRTLGSGGETLGAETYEWGKAILGLVINEFYGQTECN